jgi:hypothetical protein
LEHQSGQQERGIGAEDSKGRGLRQQAEVS